MKLTIEPSDPRLNYPTVTIEIEANDLNIGQMFDELIIPALVAAGFSEKKIDEYLGDEYPGDECIHCGARDTKPEPSSTPLDVFPNHKPTTNHEKTHQS